MPFAATRLQQLLVGGLSQAILVGHGQARLEIMLLTLDFGLSRFPCAAWSPDGKRIVVTTPLEKTVRVWKPDASGEPVVLSGHEDWVRCAAWNGDSDRVVTASADGTAGVWAANGGGARGAPGRESPVGHSAGAGSAFSPDGRHVVTGTAPWSPATQGGIVRVWAVELALASRWRTSPTTQMA